MRRILLFAKLEPGATLVWSRRVGCLPTELHNACVKHIFDFGGVDESLGASALSGEYGRLFPA